MDCAINESIEMQHLELLAKILYGASHQNYILMLKEISSDIIEV